VSGGRCGAGCGADEWEWPLAGGSASLIFGRSGLVSARVISVEAGPGIGVLTARATRAIVPWVTAPMVIEIGALAEVVARLPPLAMPARLADEFLTIRHAPNATFAAKATECGLPAARCASARKSGANRSP
jgi:hypothetical protein